MLPAGSKIFTDVKVPATMLPIHKPYATGNNAMSHWEEQIKTLEKRIEAIRGYL